jgi:soluble lytic murein transglycosylase
MLRNFRIFALAALVIAGIALMSQPGLAAPQRKVEKADPATPEDAFLAARDALKTGNRERLAQLVELFRGHPLEVYGDYWLLLANRAARHAELDDADYLAFLTKYDKTYMGERARTDWVKSLGRQGEWALFEAERAKLVFDDDIEVQCYSALHRVLSKDQAGVAAALVLWLTPRDLPQGCITMAETLISTNRLVDRQVWDRIRLLADADQLPALARTAVYLPDRQVLDPQQIEAAFKKPERFLKQNMQSATKAERELVLIALGRLAKDDPRAAAAYWNGITLSPAAARLAAQGANAKGSARGKRGVAPAAEGAVVQTVAQSPDEPAIPTLPPGKNGYTESERQWGWAQIGYGGARRLLPEAVKWFGEVSDIQLPDEYLRWMARTGLRAGDWKLTLRAIRDMSPEQRREPTWTYWLARGLREQGKTEEAKALFETIAGDFSFYGQLAASELGRVTSIPPTGYTASREEVAAVGQMPCFQRALALYRLGLRAEGNREWNFNIQKMDDKQLLAAAALARQYDLPDRAINTADRTVHLHDFSLRFLSPHYEQVKPQAVAVGLDDAWVYGLMRQESRFIVDAKSVVGASGLMQLMPSTARWVAKKIGLSDYNHSQVADLDTNITLGTNYLKIVLDELYEHQALASAAYNAGPGRPRRWRDLKPMEAAVFAESIPLNETRDYVKKVISNSVFYQALFTGKPASIKERLPLVPARRSDEKATDTP